MLSIDPAAGTVKVVSSNEVQAYTQEGYSLIALYEAKGFETYQVTEPNPIFNPTKYQETGRWEFNNPTMQVFKERTTFQTVFVIRLDEKSSLAEQGKELTLAREGYFKLEAEWNNMKLQRDEALAAQAKSQACAESWERKLEGLIAERDSAMKAKTEAQMLAAARSLNLEKVEKAIGTLKLKEILSP